MIDRDTVLTNALRHYGLKPQVWKTIEELNELCVELAHVLDGRGNLYNLAEETADVLIMVDQMVRGFDLGELVHTYDTQKIARLNQRMEEAKHVHDV